MSIQEFADKPAAFRNDPGPMFCLECRAEVEAEAIASVEVPAYFSHPPRHSNVSDLDDCSRAARSRRLRWFGDEDRNEPSGRRVRQEFFDESTVKSAYAFCLTYVGKGNLPLSKFQEMIDRADRLDVWSYAGMEVWCVPHVLLLPADFGVGTERPCHIALVRTSKLSAIWRGSSPVSIKKLFRTRATRRRRSLASRTLVPYRSRTSRASVRHGCRRVSPEDWRRAVAVSEIGAR
jgi:hypothetical protein